MNRLDEEDITKRLLDVSTRIYSKVIVDGIRDELIKREQEIVSGLERWLVSTLTRRVVHSILTNLEEIVRDAVNKQTKVIEDKLTEIIRAEIKKAVTQTAKSERMYMPQSQPISRAKVPESAEIERLRKRISDLNDRLGKFFNLMIRFEPRLQALPIIEQMGEVEIDNLARVLSISKSYLLEFLTVTSNAGITQLRGNKVKLVRPIFKSQY